MNIKTKLTLNIGVLVAMIVLLVSLSTKSITVKDFNDDETATE